MRLSFPPACALLTRTLARAKLRRENDELRRALLAQLPDADDEAGEAAGAEQMLRAALSSEQRLRAETTAELAYLRTALWLKMAYRMARSLGHTHAGGRAPHGRQTAGLLSMFEGSTRRVLRTPA